ncbi:hypothetical protein MIPYR_10340 [uncultured Microbacterium sp.]|uniref:Uncharacterized protein n=1 Tax=uncultured Microbacterium sp. TaxID=191216 RepID=A0A1Y5NUX3_9MICO|nr:hypothetical protein MIPYR_10340 [uncultured Microbacterium sp.]
MAGAAWAAEVINVSSPLATIVANTRLFAAIRPHLPRRRRDHPDTATQALATSGSDATLRSEGKVRRTW